MNLPIESEHPINAIAERAHALLENASHTPFSEAGFGMLQEKVDQFIGDLILESARVMKRRQADTISPAYVQQASENLSASTRRKKFTLIGTIGGVLLGAGISSYLEMIRRGTVTVPEVLVASAVSIAGVFMIAIQFTRD